VYHKALCYCLGISVDTRRNINSIYDFKTGCVKTECLHEGWQTSGSMKVVRMAFNLYCNGTPSVDDYTKIEGQTNITELMLNDFIEKVVIHEAEGGRTKDRIQQVDIYFNFIGNFVLPLSEDEVEALQSEEARRAEEIAERKRKSSKKSTQKRNQKRAEIKAKAEAGAGDQEAQSQLAERKQYQVRATVKSYRKMRDDALSGDPIAKVRYEKTLAMRREAYHSKKSEQTA
jgi:site-specific recombinases, DNA invertase pin homologs